MRDPQRLFRWIGSLSEIIAAKIPRLGLVKARRYCPLAVSFSSLFSSVVRCMTLSTRASTTQLARRLSTIHCVTPSLVSRFYVPCLPRQQVFTHQHFSFSPLRHFSTSSPSFKSKKMPPKKKQEAEKKVILGRPGNNLKVSGNALLRTSPAKTHITDWYRRSPQRR